MQGSNWNLTLAFLLQKDDTFLAKILQQVMLTERDHQRNIKGMNSYDNNDNDDDNDGASGEDGSGGGDDSSHTLTTYYLHPARTAEPPPHPNLLNQLYVWFPKEQRIY